MTNEQAPTYGTPLHENAIEALWNAKRFSVDEMQILVAALRHPAPPAGISPAPLAGSEEIQPTTATVPVGEIVALRRNAARYKVLRDARHGFNAYRLQPKPGKRWRGYGDEGDILKGNALDAAIDAALSQGDVSGEGEGA